MKLILNADDFGYSSKVNHAITDSFVQDLCSNTTLMVNMPFTDEAVELAHNNGFADKVGLHINLTEGRPLTDPIRKLKLFCDNSGNFNGNFHRSTISRLYLNSETVNAIRTEIDAQLEKYFRYHFTLFHLDSHQHTHTNFPVLIAIKTLIRKYNIKSIRIARNINRKDTIQKKIYKLLYNIYLSKYSPCVTNYFGSMDEYINEKNNIKDHKDIIFEIMLHPVYKGNLIFDSGGELLKKIRAIDSKHHIISYSDIKL